MHLGDFDLSTVIYGKFTTYRPGTGATFTLGGTPALSVYKDNSTTQSTTGVTLIADFDSVTGMNHFTIDTSADGTFYSAGSFFDIVITTGTVDSVSVTGSVVGRFTIRKNSALKPTTAGRTLVVDAAGLADANTVKLGPSGSGTAQTARDIGASVIVASGTVTNLTNLPTIPANWLTAAGIATGAITAAKFAADAIDAAALAATATAEIAAAVGGRTMSELTGDPGATPTADQAEMLTYMAIRNKRETDSGGGTDKIYNSAGSVILTAAIADAANVFTKAKYA
jgi:hypothetical protein